MFDVSSLVSFGSLKELGWSFEVFVYFSFWADFLSDVFMASFILEANSCI